MPKKKNIHTYPPRIEAGGLSGRRGGLPEPLRLAIDTQHPHPDKRHVMRSMRKYLLCIKRKLGSARGLGHYHVLLQTYLTAKRMLLKHATTAPALALSALFLLTPTDGAA